MTRKPRLHLAIVGALALVLAGCECECDDEIDALEARVDQLWSGMEMHQKTLDQWRDWHVNTAHPALVWAVNCLQRTSPTWPCTGGPGITPPPDSLPRNWP